MFGIHLGIPEMEELWNRLEKKHQSGSATKAEEKLRRQMGKAMVLLSGNPRHPGLHSHEITSLTARTDSPVWPKGLGILSGKRYAESWQNLLVLRSG